MIQRRLLRDWILVLGVSLDLGSWILVFSFHFAPAVQHLRSKKRIAQRPFHLHPAPVPVRTGNRPIDHRAVEDFDSGRTGLRTQLRGQFRRCHAEREKLFARRRRYCWFI